MKITQFDAGKMTKEVTSDEGDSLWVRQEAKLMNQNEVIEMLISKSDGQVLKLIRNGKEEEVPKSDLEIISQDYTEVTVPAGTFDAIHIVANTKDIKNLEVWANPSLVVMDGTLKQIIPTGLFTLTAELTSFTAGSSL